jgi:hypothetical protein
MNLKRFELDAETIEHFNDEIPEIMSDMAELDQVMEEASRMLACHLEKITRHRQRCGVCLSKQIADGTLIPIEEFWSNPDYPR